VPVPIGGRKPAGGYGVFQNSDSDEGEDTDLIAMDSESLNGAFDNDDMEEFMSDDSKKAERAEKEQGEDEDKELIEID
jgi:hypothetical protein